MHSYVGISAPYGLDGPGIEPGGGEFSALVKTGPGAKPASCTMGTRSSPKNKAAEVCGVDNPPHLKPRLKKVKPLLLHVPSYQFVG
jgi:hypothetical protein